MRKVVVYKNPYGDTRTSPDDVTPDDIRNATDEHIKSVARTMMRLGDIMCNIGQNHDYTKRIHEELFHKEFIDCIHNGTSFKDGEWYKIHCDNERHHIDKDNIKDSIDLLDIIEMIVDVACAGKARSGNIIYPELSSEVYEKAINNTKEFIEDLIVIKE